VINLRNLAVDPDGTSLSFSLAAGGKPPAGVSFDAAAAELRLGSLPFEAVGRHTFTLLASDGDAATAVPLNFEITIRERNLAPLWNLPQSLLSSQAPATGWDLISQRWVLEANGDPLRFSLSSGDARPLPAGIRLDGSRLVVDPATPAGSYALRLGASDGPERLLVQALTSLVVPAAAVAVPPTLRLEGSLRQAEGTAFGLQLRLDRPAAEELTLRWTLNPRRDSAEPLLPSRTGLVRIAAGGEGALLSLPSREDGLLLGDQELELVLESLSGAVQLPPAPTPLMLLDNDSAPQLLTSRWLNDRELELLYQPGAAGSAGTGLVVSLSDPAAAGLFDGASLSQVFLSGWLGERRENGSLDLRWSDPLAAAWPGSAAVSLARLRLDRTAATSSPAIRVEASAGEQRLVRWINSPWQAPLRLPVLEELRARLGGDARGLLVEPGLAAALAADADGGLLILDARALLERRYSPDPTLTVRRQGQTIQLDLGELIPAEAGVLRFSDGQWALLPAAARDGSPQHQASQSLLLRSGDGGGELSDLSLGGVSAAARTAIQHLSGGADPLFGELAFHIRGLTPGALSSVEITLPQSGVTSPLLLKQDAAGAWLPFAFDPITGTGAMFHDDDGNGSADRVVLWSRDGGRGDRDGLANGVIVDPVVFAGAIPPPTLSIAAALADRAEGTGGSTAFSFSVYRDGDTSGTSSAQWTVQGSGAKPAAADDFAGGVFSSGTVVFATGEATRTITVPVAADSSVEADETFRVSLSEASGAVIDATANVAIGTIRNDDRPAISLVVAPARILENGGAALIYTFSRNGDPADALTVDYSVSGTALVAVDYSGIAVTPTIRSVSFAAGAATALVTLTPISDSESEPEETVALTLVEGAGYRIGTTAAVVGSIADEDPLITLSLAPTAVSENGSTNLTYIFSRSGSTSTALTVQYSVAGSASLGSDYSGLAASPAIKSLTIAAGSASASVTVDPNADSESEADETVALSLVAGAGYRIGSTAAVVGTILNGDGYIPGPTTINGVNLGSTSLGYGLRNGGGAPIQITFPGGNASASNPGSGWGATAISGSATGYNLYWRNSGSGEVVVWQLNSGGAYTGGQLLSAAQVNSEEFNLNLDLNNDGYIAGPTTINGVNLGSTSLGYALRNGGGAPIQITFPGGNASASNPGSGWGATAISGSATGYNLYWR
ncbi:MAG: Calx-beta domain-containing protein, partial [Synechococcaceae cyanobacterium]